MKPYFITSIPDHLMNSALLSPERGLMSLFFMKFSTFSLNSRGDYGILRVAFLV
jgi:hypothetical protein